MHIQALIEGMSAQWQRERSKTQMTLGSLIDVLEAMPSGAEVANINYAHSYRGYYCDLAFERGDGLRHASDLLAECRNAMGSVFNGYKGGNYVMGALTPVWVAFYGETGVRLMSLHAGGEIETEEEN